MLSGMDVIWGLGIQIFIRLCRTAMAGSQKIGMLLLRQVHVPRHYVVWIECPFQNVSVLCHLVSLYGCTNRGLNVSVELEQLHRS